MMNIRNLMNHESSVPTSISEEQQLKQQIYLLEIDINIKTEKLLKQVQLLSESLSSIQTEIVKLENQQEVLSKAITVFMENNAAQEIPGIEEKIQLNNVSILNYKKSESSLVEFFRNIMLEIQQAQDFERLNLLKSELSKLESRNEIGTFLNTKENKVTNISNFGLFEQTQINNNDNNNNNNNNNKTPHVELASQTFKK